MSRLRMLRATLFHYFTLMHCGPDALPTFIAPWSLCMNEVWAATCQGMTGASSIIMRIINAFLSLIYV